MRSILVLAGLLAVAATQLQEPGELALVLNEDEFEDHLDAYLEQEQSRLPIPPRPSKGCTLRINGDLGQPQPVYLRDNRYLTSDGNTGQIRLNSGEQVLIACPGQSIRHRNIAARTATRAVATATCVNNNLVSGAGWLNGHGAFGQLTCSAQSSPVIQQTTERCWNNHVVIRVGYNVNDVFYPLYGSCFDQQHMQVLYVWHSQSAEHAVHQTRVARPSTWQSGNFFPGVDPRSIYTQVNQKAVLTHYLGAESAKKYITRKNASFLARGHLAAKSDFVFATGQRATFFYINAAPQWQSINAGNWNRLEQNLRARIGAAGYNTVVYTGTFGVMKLGDEKNPPKDIYLSRPSQIPVPLYFYKVVYDASLRKGTAFITINNPHCTMSEAEKMAENICRDRCRNNNDFNWLKWKPDSVQIGYSFCCTVDEFRSSIPHLPAFQTNGLLF